MPIAGHTAAPPGRPRGGMETCRLRQFPAVRVPDVGLTLETRFHVLPTLAHDAAKRMDAALRAWAGRVWLSGWLCQAATMTT